MQKKSKPSTGSCCHAETTTSHTSSISHELLCHFPYAVFAVALSLVFLTLFGYTNPTSYRELHGLFHTLHFLHILFAATGTVLVFRKYGGSLLGSLGVGMFVPAVFCTLSDAIMPYFGGLLCGIPMHFHFCFRDHFTTILLFLVVGVVNGIVMSFHDSDGQQKYATTAHFAHIFISAFASTVYMISHGFSDWYQHMGFVFSFLLIAVLIPCTLADVVVPAFFGGMSAKSARARRHGE
ncbi:MAG: hypothetical protein QG632_465 [Candidatus Dependentiae bacterium]|nr:hypothetical protein [Candidatus Dependentiae bacterium]